MVRETGMENREHEWRVMQEIWRAARRKAMNRDEGGRRGLTQRGQHHVNQSAHTRTNTQERCG